MINGMYALDKAPTDCKSISFSEQRKAKKTISDAMKKLCIGSDVGNGIDEETTRILSGDGGTGFDAKALQNRDRSRASYVAQMTKIAKNPDYDMISTSKTPETGAPMVFSRNTAIPPAQAGKKETITMADGKGGKEKITSVYAVIEADELQASHNADGTKNDAYGSNSGIMALNNGRSAGIKQAYKQGNADEYKAKLIKDKSHGISPKKISEMRNPVLVRVFSESDVSHIENIGTASNVSMGAELSASEQANSDASRLSDASVSSYKGGDIASLANRDFVRGFISDMGGTEAVGAMISKDGSVTAQGIKRIESALVAKAYNDDNILTDITESTDSELRSLGDALKDVAGRWSVMRSYAKDGAIAKNMDITNNLTEALQLVMKSRREGIKIAELLKQIDAFSGNVSPITESLVKLMFSGENMSRIRSSEVIKKALHGFIDQAMNSSEGADMFGDEASPEPLIAQQQDDLEKADAMKKSQTSMFDSVVSNYFAGFLTFREQRSYKKSMIANS